MPLEFVEPTNPVEVTTVPPNTLDRPDEKTVTAAICESEELARLCQELAAASELRRRTYLRWQASLGVILLSAAAILITLVLVSVFGLGEGVSRQVYFVFLASLIASLVGAGGYLRFTSRSAYLNDLVRRVIAADNTATTAALIDALGIDDADLAQSARRQLTHLAPRWTEADLAALTAEQRDGLRRILDGVQTRRHGDASGAATGGRYLGERTELRIAICSALGELGNDQDLQVMRRLSRFPAVSSSNRQVGDAALLAAGELEARLAGRHRPHTLLRASNAPPTSPVELVRAAASPAATPPEQLLRPE